MRRAAERSSGAAGLFVLIGILTILAVTFAAGTYAGRIWATRPHTVASVSPPDREHARRGADSRSSRLPDPAPRLTFYQELTAPLTAPPPPPKPAKTSPPPLVTNGAPATRPSMPERVTKPIPETRVAHDAAAETLVGRDAATTISNRPPTTQTGLGAPATTTPATTTPATTTPATTSPATTIAATSARFTIQVAAYRLRPPADELRAKLAAAGHDARVVENDAANGIRYRVQIGDFVSRDAARDAAARLTGPTFITTR